MKIKICSSLKLSRVFKPNLAAEILRKNTFRYTDPEDLLWPCQLQCQTYFNVTSFSFRSNWVTIKHIGEMCTVTSAPSSKLNNSNTALIRVHKQYKSSLDRNFRIKYPIKHKQGICFVIARKLHSIYTVLLQFGLFKNHYLAWATIKICTWIINKVNNADLFFMNRWEQQHFWWQHLI